MDYKNMTTFNGTPIESIIGGLPVIDKNVNDDNIKIFKKYGIYDSAENRYTCVLCKSNTSIDNSISSRGNKLICVPCAYKYFEGDYAAAFYWNGGGN